MRLFGGAITAEVPASLLDASDLREVPDNQEVFVGTYQEFDVSMIIELLEPVDKENIIDALVYHADEAHRVSDISPDDHEQPVETMTMDLGKHHFAEIIDVVNVNGGYISIVFGLFRLPEYKTDVLVTCSLNPQTKKPGAPEIDSQQQVVRNLVKTFHVIDAGLFGKEVEEVEQHKIGHHGPESSQ